MLLQVAAYVAGRTMPLSELVTQLAGQGSASDALQSVALDVATRRSFAAKDGAPFSAYVRNASCMRLSQS